MGDALSQGYRAGRDLAAGILAAVGAKVLEIQANGQLSNIQVHFGKLTNPNQPGGDDPNWRDKWKRDIRRGIQRLREKIDKMKGKQREKWEEIVRQAEERLNTIE